jgi:hypothetical protein
MVHRLASRKIAFDEEIVKDLHQTLVDGIINGGIYRSRDLFILGAKHVPPSYLKIYKKMDDYFEKELNIPVYHSPKEFEFNNKKFLIGHGDGLGPGDHGYKRMKKVFTNPVSKWFYRWLHPDLGVPLAQHLE